MPKILLGNYDNIKTEDVVDILEVNASNHTKDALTMELESFVNVVEADLNPIVDGVAGTRALKIALQIVKKINNKLKG